MNEYVALEDKLQMCPICGSKPMIHCGAAAEIYGRSIQTVSIECTDSNRQHCILEVSMALDADVIVGQLDLLMDTWNKIRRQKTVVVSNAKN